MDEKPPSMLAIRAVTHSRIHFNVDIAGIKYIEYILPASLHELLDMKTYRHYHAMQLASIGGVRLSKK